MKKLIEKFVNELEEKGCSTVIVSCFKTNLGKPDTIIANFAGTQYNLMCLQLEIGGLLIKKMAEDDAQQ